MTEKPAPIPGLTEGRIVHYVLPHGRGAGQHRPAIVVKDWKSHEYAGAPGSVNLHVFTDHTNDFQVGEGSDGHLWATSIRYSEEKEPGTWHWIEVA